MSTITVYQALKEQVSRQDVTNTAQMKAWKEPPVGLEREPQPSLLATNPEQSLIWRDAANTTNREEMVELGRGYVNLVP